MKNIKKISTNDFWSNYSKVELHFCKHPDLPLKLNLNIFFDVYFGLLTQHKFITCNASEVLLNCENCVHVNSPKLDVCIAHIGIIQGQIETVLTSSLVLTQSIEDRICTIRKMENER